MWSLLQGSVLRTVALGQSVGLLVFLYCCCLTWKQAVLEVRRLGPQTLGESCCSNMFFPGGSAPLHAKAVHAVYHRCVVL